MIRSYPLHALLLLVLLAIWILLSFYNVLVDDDLVFLNLVHDKGILDATRYQYDTWNTRWMSFLWLHVWMQFWTPDSSLLAYHALTLGALTFASFRMLRGLQSLNRVRHGSFTDTLFMAGLMACAIVVSTYHIGDTWFWVNTSTMYGWNLIVMVWACSVVVMPYNSVGLNFLSHVLCGLYTGGSSEPAVVSLLFLSPALFFRSNLTAGQRRYVLIFLSSVCVAFVIAYFGQGHVKREDALPDAGPMRWAGLSAWYFLRIIAIESPLRILMVLALLWPLRIRTEKAVPREQVSFHKPFIVWLTTTAIHCGLIVAIMGDYGPPRALSFIGLVSVFGVLIAMPKTDKVWPVGLERAVTLSALLMAGWTLAIQANALPKYRKYVIEVNNGEQQFKPEDVPDSGLLHRLSFKE